MAPVRISSVVSFSSQDPRFPVENLLREDRGGPWLCCPRDRSRWLRAELQLEAAMAIGYLDLGNCGCALVQVEVGRSSWPRDHPYVPLVPGVPLMTPAESRAGENRCGVRMFKEADFLEPAVGQKWDRVRLTCSQPFSRQGQFGLSFLRLRTPSDPQPDPQPEGAHSPQRCSPAICRMLCAQTGSWGLAAGGAAQEPPAAAGAGPQIPEPPCPEPPPPQPPGQDAAGGGTEPSQKSPKRHHGEQPGAGPPSTGLLAGRPRAPKKGPQAAGSQPPRQLAAPPQETQRRTETPSPWPRRGTQRRGRGGAVPPLLGMFQPGAAARARLPLRRGGPRPQFRPQIGASVLGALPHLPALLQPRRGAAARQHLRGVRAGGSEPPLPDPTTPSVCRWRIKLEQKKKKNPKTSASVWAQP
ncbi:protein XNDC1N isoform X4 [Anas platyrhynchos]|uniref:protein XNDC1N isoform X4 n=1 Tax=Anas platyrhynchos TaxID=8839 RepID=UPI003AF30DB9